MDKVIGTFNTRLKLTLHFGLLFMSKTAPFSSDLMGAFSKLQVSALFMDVQLD